MERPCMGPRVDSSREDPRRKSVSITRHMDEDPLWWGQAPSSQTQHIISGRSGKGLLHVLTNWSLSAVSAVVTDPSLSLSFSSCLWCCLRFPILTFALPPRSFQSPCWRRMILKLPVLGNSKAGEGSVLGHEEIHVPNFWSHYVTWAPEQLRVTQSPSLAVSHQPWSPWLLQ